MPGGQMRPPTADSQRPYTSAGGRPVTSAGAFDRDAQYTYSQEWTLEEEESDVEDDLFAFGPPSTADQQGNPRQEFQQQQHQLYAQSFDPVYQPAQQQQVLSAPKDVGSSPPAPAYPSPTFDPNARYPADTMAASQAALVSFPPSGPSSPLPQSPPTPSTNNPYDHPIPARTSSMASHPSIAQHNLNQGPYTQPHTYATPQPTPSVDSDALDNDPYRMRKISSKNEHGLPTTATTIPATATTTASSREVRVSLPSGHGQHEKDLEAVRETPKRLNTGSIDAESMSIGPSMMEDYESREGSIKMEFDFDAIEEEDSPYPEVRASVSNIDDPDMPAMTIRMWFVGLLLCMVSSALNVFFNFRSPAPTIVPLALLLVAYPFGKVLAFSLPITTYRLPLPPLPAFLFRSSPSPPTSIEFSLNPGPWNIKEHVLVYIMANVAVGSPYAMNAIVVSEVFYEIHLGFWFNLVLVLATQLTGFGLAGLCRRFLVWPASMVWPQNLVACALLNTLHAEDDEGTGGVSRYKYFMLVSIGTFFYFFLPGFLFQALSLFSYICWAAPNNVPVNQLFGVHSGLGMGILNFDWTQISWIGSPLMVPWWAEVHIFFGFVLFYWILTPILYYTNTWYLAHFPISANEPYDRFGRAYNVNLVLKTDDTFDLEAYNNYSPLYLPATYAMTYLLAFALSTCVIVHTALYHGKTLWNGVKKIRIEQDDIHAKLMRNYPEVPDWWYASAFVIFFCLAVVAVEVWDTSVPVWALLLSVFLPVVYILPSGFIYAMTGQPISLNILAQIIPGSLLPGNPLANMVFKAYSVQTLTAGTSFVQDLKLGHYVKVPPRATFLVQSVATILAAFIQVGTKQWIFTNVPDICKPFQTSQLTCPHNQVFFTASAVWGLIGPSRQFGQGSIYHPHLYALIIGAFLPLPFWLWQRRFPESWVKYISTPVVLNGVSAIPPATGINYSSWFLVGFIFQYLIRKRNFAWWSKFNYVTSAALDSGTVIALILIFFTLQFPKGGTLSVDWWGNNVFLDTADFRREALLPIPEGGIGQRP